MDNLEIININLRRQFKKYRKGIERERERSAEEEFEPVEAWILHTGSTGSPLFQRGGALMIVFVPHSLSQLRLSAASS